MITLIESKQYGVVTDAYKNNSRHSLSEASIIIYYRPTFNNKHERERKE